jgi:hypothetical protein
MPIYPIAKYENLCPDFPDIIQIEHLAEKFLRFISRKIPMFPSHGVDHSTEIIKIIDSMINDWGLTLSCDETYLLYLAAWLHDIGCIKAREDHNQCSADIIRNSEFIQSILNDVLMQYHLECIVTAHSSSCEIDDVPIRSHNIRLRFVSAIFRIADACEINNTKCPPEVYNIICKSLDAESILYWEAHRAILGMIFKPGIICYWVTDELKSAILINHLREEINSVRKTFIHNNITVPKVQVETVADPRIW